jgi:hypothetical protein
LSASKSRSRDIRRTRRRRHGCWGHLIAAPLWVAWANLGVTHKGQTLLC